MLGSVTTLRVRVAHGGATDNWLPAHFYDAVQCGGGAMMDLGAHVMYLTRWFLGRPVRAVALFNKFTDHAVEDNAVTVFEFPGRAIAMAERRCSSRCAVPAAWKSTARKGHSLSAGRRTRCA